jgi:hypothetical protein
MSAGVRLMYSCSVGQWLQYSKTCVNPDCRLNVSFLCWPVHCTAHASPSGPCSNKHVSIPSACMRLECGHMFPTQQQQHSRVVRCQRQTTDCTWHMLLHFVSAVTALCIAHTVPGTPQGPLQGQAIQEGCGRTLAQLQATALLPALLCAQECMAVPCWAHG